MFPYRRFFYPLISVVFAAVFTFSLKMPWYLAVVFAAAVSYVIYVLDYLIVPEYLLENEAHNLAERVTDPHRIVQFLNRKRASQRIVLLASACIASVIAVSTVVWSVIFFAVAPQDAPEEPYAAAILGTIAAGGTISLAICLQVFFYSKQRGQAALEVLRNSTQAVCVQGMQAYDDQKALERAERVYLHCPSCAKIVVPPETMETPGDIVCEHCSARLRIIVTNGASDMPVFVTDTHLIICAGPHRGAYDLDRLSDPLLAGRSVSFRYEDRLISSGHMPEAAFAKVLDIYESHHPYAGQPTCWYCGQRAGVCSSATSFPIYKTLGSWQKGSVTFTDYNKMAIAVPRCEECAATHKTTFRQVRGGTLLVLASIGALAGFVALFRVFPENPPGGLMALIFLWFFSLFGAGLYVLYRDDLHKQRRLQEQGIKPYWSIDLFPPYRRLWNEGFRPGAKPGFREHFNLPG